MKTQLGYGTIEDNEETREMGLAGKDVLVLSNAPRGYFRVYIAGGNGPYIVKAEYVVLR